MGERTDADLVARARGGSRDAAAELFERYWGAAWRAAYAVTGRRAMADDVAQDAFERAFAALGRFDERRPFGPWLHRIVVNRALDLLRSERRLVGEVVEAEWVDVRDGDVALLDAVSALPLQRRVVVVLRFGLGLTPSAIAEVLGVPVGTVSSRLARALDQLRAQYEESDVEQARD
ncbi:MAG TPA: RNA polymerase sigma factor [Gaiellaceae bacterium]